MPITDTGDYDPLTKQQIAELLEDKLKEDFGEDIDLSESSVFATIVDVIAESSSEELTPTLAEIYKGAFLETAEGIALDRVVEILGIIRINARRATGVVTFSREEPAHQTFTIQSGTVIQTDSQNPVRFETMESTNIELYADFEGNTVSDFSGNLSSFDTTSNSANVHDGVFALQYDSASANETIWQPYSQKKTHRGTELSVRVKAPDGTVPRQLFGTTDNNNTYYTEIDTTSGGVGNAVHGLYVREDGADTLLDSQTITWDDTEYTENIIDWGLNGEMSSVILDDDGNELSSIEVTDEMTFIEGGFGFENGTATECYWDTYTSYSTSVNIRAIEGGVDGNTGANTVIVLPSVPAGVEEVSNPYPVGDFNYLDIHGQTYTIGRERETDDALKERVRNTIGQAGSATIDSIAAEIRNLEGVRSVFIFENKDVVIDADGRPQQSFEPVVLGGNEQEIIDAIYDKKAATARDTGGHVGSLVEGTAVSSITGQEFTIQFSRPTAINVTLTLDIVVDDTYIGNDNLRNEIVNYIGGSRTDGATRTGLTTGQDVTIDQITDTVVSEDTGVIGISNLSTTPTTTTDANGLEVIEISNNEVATADATDSSIVINVTVV